MLNPRANIIAMSTCAMAGIASLALGYVVGLAPLVAFGWLASGTAIGLFLAMDRPDDEDATRRSTGPVGMALTTLEMLNDLELRAKVKGAFDVAQLLDRLEKLHPRFAGLPNDAAGLATKLKQLFDTSAASLSRAYDLHVAARELATATARQEVEAEQDRLVQESAAAVDALEKGIDRFATAAATAGASDNAADLSDLSGDLDRQLEVARRVEQRMKDLERKAAGDYSAAEAYVKDN